MQRLINTGNSYAYMITDKLITHLPKKGVHVQNIVIENMENIYKHV